MTVLFVHAHPDDETLWTGIAMAAYAADGHDVHLLTCTLGEEGEVIPPGLRHLEGTDALGPYRAQELRRAMAVLGVTHQVLGYRDSGMAGMPSGRRPDAFVNADLDAAAARVAQRVEELRPDRVVTYEEHGGYGHPDHIQTHRVTMAALRRLGAGAPPAYAAVIPRSWAREDRAWLSAHVDRPGVAVRGPDDPFPPSVVPDDLPVDAVVRPDLIPPQALALAEHSTQVAVFDGYYTLSDDVAARLSGREAYARLDPATGGFTSVTGAR